MYGVMIGFSLHIEPPSYSPVRPKLEYCIQAWNPSLIKDIELLEQVQHRATKLIPEIAHLSYHDRLKYLNLTTIELIMIDLSI